MLNMLEVGEDFKRDVPFFAECNAQVRSNIKTLLDKPRDLRSGLTCTQRSGSHIDDF